MFVLVHGSTQSSRGWDLLIAELERRGQRAVTVDLPADQPDASAMVYAERIATAVPADSADAIVVAHSASGLFLPLVPSYRQVGRLVFLAAVIPKIGSSLLDQVQEEPDMLNPNWRGKDPTKDDAVALEFLFHDCSAEVAALALGTRQLLLAREAMVEVCPLVRWPEVPCSYVLCREDRTIRAEWARRVVPGRLGVAAIEMGGGHCPHVCRAGELADVLVGLR